MSDLFGGFGGLLKGLSGFMPQDNPDLKLLTAQSEVGELQKQELEIYVQIGKQALLRGSGQFPELENRLCLIQENLSTAQAKLQSAQSEKEASEAAARTEEERLTCSSCGNVNPDGVRSCQECGTKLGTSKCSACNAPLPPGTRFCGGCGARQEG